MNPSDPIAYVRCPWEGCEETIHITIRVHISEEGAPCPDKPGYSLHTITCEPDLTDVWAHAWSHDEAS